MDDSVVLAIIQAVQRDLNATMQTGRYSPHILRGLVVEAFQGRSTGPIIQEIYHLENLKIPSRARKARKFKGPVLGGKGLWYKHYFQAGLLAQNVWDEFRFGSPASTEKLRNALFPITKESTEGFFVPDGASTIADIMVNGMFMHRSIAG